MNWRYWRRIPWTDTRAKFVAEVPARGNLLDLGSSNGQTLGHFFELRPDLSFAASDFAGTPETYPPDTDFKRADFDADRLPWPDSEFDAITCMHVVEHLQDPAHMLAEAARVLKPGGRIYVETPHPKSLTTKSARGSAVVTVTMNFFDDPTHVRVVTTEALSRDMRLVGLVPEASGVSRNLFFAAAYPFYAALGSTSRKRFVAQLHWTGWSAYIVARSSNR
ncbi:MAG: methyltransferase domain-containing protein [Gemmatimonadota bacterium]|nr:methyltransferase domain-containing protein [Gemmatimonadota bacterium]